MSKYKWMVREEMHTDSDRHKRNRVPVYRKVWVDDEGIPTDPTLRGTVADPRCQLPPAQVPGSPVDDQPSGSGHEHGPAQEDGRHGVQKRDAGSPDLLSKV